MRIGLRAHFIAVHSSHPKGGKSATVKPKVSRWVPVLDEVIPGERCCVVQDINLVHGYCDRPSEGWWRLEVRHGKVRRSLVIASDEPTMYPYEQGVELRRDGTIVDEHAMFETCSTYIWPTIKTEPAWQVSQYISASIGRQHREGMTVDGWFDVLDALHG